MAFKVRIFGHRGLDQLKVNLPKQFSSDAIYQLVYPYEWRQTLTTNLLVPQRSTAQAMPDKTEILRIEVADGNSIRYEISAAGVIVDADADSPILSGINQMYFRQGYTLSIIDAANT